MSSTITLPVWLVLILAALAVLALVDDFFIPGIRWFVRRRVNRVIHEVNARLRLELPTFQLTKRRVVVDRLVHDPEVMKTAAAMAAERGVPREVVMDEVAAMAREMVPAFNAFFYFKLGYWCARRFLRALYRVRLGFAHEGTMADIPPDTAVVFFSNHRSNFDYVLVTYLASHTLAVSYGAGEWARVWPFRIALRLAGAYILRRDTGDPLYRKVLLRYVQMATEACVPHAIFAEGQLSRDGAIHAPKLGILGYITRAFDPAGPYDIRFVPVATNFDRVAEERTLIVNPDTDFKGRGPWFMLRSGLGFLAWFAGRKLSGRWRSFGVACANFGEPLSLRVWSNERGIDFSRLPREELFAAVEQLGAELTRRVIDIVPVLAVPLVSVVLVEADGPLGPDEIRRRALRWLDEARDLGAQVGLEEGSEAEAVDAAVRTLRRRGLVVERSGGGFAPADHERLLLAYYAASVQQVRSQLEQRKAGPD